ncbi:MAG: glycosyltransferase family A protein [Candidatus Binatus sp.]
MSVIIPVYNGAATIGRALASAFAQTFTDYEVVVVNDGSTDATSSVLAGYGDRIRVVTQANRGLPAARNSGIRASSGEYVAFIDDDDEWLPQMLERCAAVLDEDAECGLVYAGALKVDLAGRPMPDQGSENDDIDSPTMEQMLARPWVVVPSRVMVRRTILDRCEGFEERCVVACEDVFFSAARARVRIFSPRPRNTGAQEHAPALSQGSEARTGRRTAGAAGARALRRVGRRFHPRIPPSADEGYEAYRAHSDGGGAAAGCAPMPRARHRLSAGVAESLPAIFANIPAGACDSRDLEQ